MDKNFRFALLVTGVLMVGVFIFKAIIPTPSDKGAQQQHKVGIVFFLQI